MAIRIAKEWNADILSLDSLSLYKEIDIVSAKPSVEEREGIPHHGIDIIRPDEPFDVTLFVKLYHELRDQLSKSGKNLIIVGGTGFYLKMMMDGISPLPDVDDTIRRKVAEALNDRKNSYQMLCRLDPEYMHRIAEGDSYRIEKALEIHYATGLSPSNYFRIHPPKPAITTPLPLYRISVDRDLLKKRISQRTEKMFRQGLIDEVAGLEYRYGRRPNCMKAIGIKETLAYLDGAYNIDTLASKIITNTARLAKRQTTFNRSQFGPHTALDLQTLEKTVLEDIGKEE